MIGFSWHRRALFEVTRDVAARRRLSPGRGSETRRARGATGHWPPGFGKRLVQSSSTRRRPPKVRLCVQPNVADRWSIGRDRVHLRLESRHQALTALFELRFAIQRK
jgi:hypothetical protein